MGKVQFFFKPIPLYSHRKALKKEWEKIGTLLKTIDNTINHLKGKKKMKDKEIFDGFCITLVKKAKEGASYAAAEEIVGNREALTILYPHHEIRMQMIQRWLENRGANRNVEWLMRCKDGSTRIVSWSDVSNDCPVPGWAGWAIGVDITAGKNALKMLQSIQQIQSHYIVKHTPSEIFSLLLQQILSATSLDAIFFFVR